MGFQLYRSSPVPLPPSEATGDGYRLWAEKVTDKLNSLSQFVYDVRDFRAVGDGVTDDTSAIQAAIDAATSSGDPTTTTRLGLGTVYLPVGAYRITAPLNFRSIKGFHFSGAGSQTEIVCDGTFAAALKLDGVAYSLFEKFTLKGYDGNEDITSALWLYWGTGTKRSVYNNRFAYIDIINLRYRKAFEIGEPSATNQVDTTSFLHCHAAGAWSSGETTYYQSGFHVGSGVFANNLMHHFFGCTSTANRYGVYVANSQVAWFGGQLQESEVDINAIETGYCIFQGFRSEDSERLLDRSPGSSGTDGHITLADIVWHPNEINADGYWIRHRTGGTLILQNVQVPPGATYDPVVQTQGSDHHTVIADGVSTQTAFGSAFSLNANGRLLVRSYIQLDAAAVSPLAITPYYVGDDAIFGGALDHDGSTVGFYATAPQTRQDVTGSRSANAALASLLTALATIGLITDSSS